MMTVNRKELFLEATAGERWKTLDEVVEDLDLAGYWPKGLADTTKRELTREMIATLKFDATSPLQLVGMDTFVSLQREYGSGNLVRVYKQFGECTFEDLDEIILNRDIEVATFREFRRQLREAVGLLGENPEEAADILLQELTESTMRLAWGEDKTLEDRRMIVAFGLLAYPPPVSSFRPPNGTSQRPGAVRQRSRAKLHPTRRLYERFNHLLEDKTPYAQEEIGWYSAEFEEVLIAAAEDEFGWTLDEYMQVAVEGR
jgi:hypothetical protein